jgi:FlaA1/EpsC-like NDP-sugar epimerase
VIRVTSSEIKYEELFSQIVGRPETEIITLEQINKIFSNSRILIIGAGGSIGSALARRIVDAEIKDLFFLDRDESALHALALGLSDVAASHSDKCLVGDVRDSVGLENIFRKIEPSVVIHAAALKHLVILEKFPREGFLTNILGTLNVAQVAARLNADQFINISTDKAAKPSSVLGKTKKIAELVCEDVFFDTKSRQCSVRFGNVFASRGSVIETFIHQITNDLPITITHEDVARFFMSKNEAANLVLASASLDDNGTYIQNMGQEVKIVDVVKRLANHFGKKPNIKFIGMQKGEKLNEELFDCPAQETEYPHISRSIHGYKRGIVNEVLKRNPANDKEATLIIDELMKNWVD